MPLKIRMVRHGTQLMMHSKRKPKYSDFRFHRIHEHPWQCRLNGENAGVGHGLRALCSG